MRVGEAPFFLGLVIAVAVLASASLARLFEVPYPVFLVLTGLVASFVPGTPTFTLSPDVIFYVFLPPLIYFAAFLTSPRALRNNWLPIGLLAVGLVLVTMVVTAFVAGTFVAGLSLGAAFVLGAIVAPTDPVAATAVFGRLGAPRRLSHVLEGESLVNDGIALVLYGLAISASMTGRFSLVHGILRFGEVVAGGLAWGLIVGYAVVLIRRRIHDAGIEITLSLFTPFIAYIPADRASLSGVLATVAAGLFIGSRSEGLFRPGVRLQARAFWDQLDFLLNSVLFVLLGLQFRDVVAAQSDKSVGHLVGEAAVVCGIVIAVRVVWQFLVPQQVWTMGRSEQAPASGRERLLLGWGGIRGAISLAAALAVPLDLSPGQGSERATILYLTFAVILATLVIQGTSLPWVIRGLGLASQEAGSPERHETRLAMIDAAITRADELGDDGELPTEVITELREDLERQRRLVERELDEDEERADGEERLPTAQEYRRARHELLAAQRSELNRRGREGGLSEDEARQLRRQLDLEESQLG